MSSEITDSAEVGDFGFADFNISSQEWDQICDRPTADVMNPSSDNGRRAWTSDSD